jgi:uncharacterized protein (DUF983 family)
MDQPTEQTEAQQRATLHVAANAGCCPYCGSGAIDGGFIEIDEGTASQKVGCNECDREWIDLYTLTGMLEVDP